MTLTTPIHQNSQQLPYEELNIPYLLSSVLLESLSTKHNAQCDVHNNWCSKSCVSSRGASTLTGTLMFIMWKFFHTYIWEISIEKHWSSGEYCFWSCIKTKTIKWWKIEVTKFIIDLLINYYKSLQPNESKGEAFCRMLNTANFLSGTTLYAEHF